MASVVVRAPAKINLHLAVGAPRADGYHDLATVFHAVDLCDELVASDANDLSLTITGDGADDLPVDEDNLVIKAARLLAEHAGRDALARLRLTKAIPVAGGMAGGSADAAAALVACDALWRLATSREDLVDLAARLGSDVPFALHGGTAVGTGRGERLTAVLARGSFHWVLAVADRGLSTPAVYRECDRLRGDDRIPVPQVSEDVMRAIGRGDAAALGIALGNDLQDAAISLRPALRLCLEAGEDAGALGGVVSGSGPTCAFLARDAEHAIDIAVSLSASGVCRTVKRATGPAPGARVVESR